nr:hypothetical protein [Tanacetum cinerariifolium]
MVPNGDEASTSHNVFNDRLGDAYFDATEALRDVDWVSAMQEELDQFPRLKVWRLVLRPEGKSVIKAKWIFKNKKDESSLTTFLNEILKEEVNVGQPPGFVSKQYPDHVYALDKVLYGLKQAPRAWYGVLSQFLIESGFQKGSIDTTLFIKKKGKHIMLIQIYVDDIIFGSTNPKYCTKFSDLMVKRFETSVMGEMKFFHGLQVNQFSNGIFINQSKYILDILKRFGLENCDSVPTPMVKQAKLKLDLVGKPVDHTDYRSMIGSLMYVTSSRPDIMFATSESEYVAVSGYCAQVLWMSTQLTDYGFFYDKVPIYCDSKSAIAMSCNPVQHTRTKHIDVSLEPGLSNLNETRKSSNQLVSKVNETSKNDLEDLFQNFYDEYFDPSKIMKSSTTNVETPINDEVFHEVSESFQGESSSSSLNDDMQQSPEEVIPPQTNTQSISINMIPNEMASKQFSLEPGLSNLNETRKSLNPSVSNVDEASKKDLEDLFHDFYNEYFDSSKDMKSSTTNVETSINEEAFHEVSESFQGESSSSSLNDDVQQSPEEDSYFDTSTSFHDLSNVQTFYQPYPHENKWTKDHPLHKIIGDPKSSVRTRSQLENSCLLSSIEPANVAEALRDDDWVSTMQEEHDQFARLKV